MKIGKVIERFLWKNLDLDMTFREPCLSSSWCDKALT